MALLKAGKLILCKLLSHVYIHLIRIYIVVIYTLSYLYNRSTENLDDASITEIGMLASVSFNTKVQHFILLSIITLNSDQVSSCVPFVNGAEETPLFRGRGYPGNDMF